jgi:periplasmic protein TonB
MDTNKILSASMLDILFENRNKDYGAYDLRLTYPRRIKKALTITVIVFGLGIGGTLFANGMKPVRVAKPKYLGREIVEVKPEDKKPDPLPEKPKPIETRSVPYTAQIQIVNEPITEPLPTIDEIDSSAIDTKFREGKPPTEVVEPKLPDGDKGIIDKPVESDEPRMIVEIDAKFIGNWENFLRRNLNPDFIVSNGAPAGRYTVRIQFIVDKEGNVSDIKALTNHGFGMEEEAIRVIKKATKWEPAIQNGYKVKAYRTQPITFEILDED